MPLRLGRRALPIAGALVALTALGACAYNEALGRNQLMLADDQAINSQSNAAWAELKRTQTVSNNAAQNQRVRTVGQRVVQAAGMGNRSWEYAVFVDDSPNAFTLPTGQIGVTTGMLNLVSNDDQLAAVIGHEIAHVVARHAQERYSQTAASSLAVQAGQGLVGSDYAQVAGMIGSAGAQFGLLLPFSRNHELEADRLGVDYLAAAGYRPSEAIALWQLMAQQRQSSVPQFASTHPSDSTRIEQLRQYIASRGWS